MLVAVGKNIMTRHFTGLDYIKFIWRTPICKQVPANQNNRPCDARWVAYVEECKKEKLRQRLFGKGK